MYKKTVKINNVIQIKSFHNIASSYSEDIDIIKGRYVIDAKSIMGLYTIDLSQPFEVAIHTDNVNIASNLFSELGNMIC